MVNVISTKLYGFILIALLAASGLALFQLQSKPQTTSQQPYIGISFCGNTTQQAITLIDRVKNYTNLFVVQTGETAHNETLLTEICDYAVDSGLDLIVFFGWLEPTQHWQFPWILDAKEKYGDKFLGIYYYDEPGGIEMDFDWPSYFQAWAARGIRQTQFYHNTTEAIQGFTDESVRNYTDATQRYINFMKGDSNMTRLHQNKIDVFTSDYALYWYD